METENSVAVETGDISGKMAKMPKKSLAGVKVLEYCESVSGAYCTKLMADLGAQVTKIEAPVTGDSARKKPPFSGNVADPEKSLLFLYLNTNKFGITLNTRTPEGIKVFKELTADADILVADRPPGEMEGMSIGYEALKKLNPGLILLSLTPYGRSGPYHNYKAYQLNTSHISGQGYLLPLTDPNLERPPVKGGGNSGNFDSGSVSVVAVLAALFWKSKSGEGQFIEVSKQEALMSMQRVESETFPQTGVNLSRKGMERNNYVGGILPCKDGHVAIITPEKRQQKALMTLIGKPDWGVEDTEEQELTDKEQKLIKKWMARNVKEDIFRKGQALSIPVAPINSAEDIEESRQFNARKFFVETQHPVIGKIEKFPSSPYRFSKTPWAIERPAPQLGEHNETIYCDRLGYSKKDLAKLKEAAVI